VPGSIFIVEDVELMLLVRNGYRTVRLVLGDGKLCIEAYPKGELHGLIHNGHVYPGCYIRAEQFDLRYKQVDEQVQPETKRQAGTTSFERETAEYVDKSNWAVYLFLKDFVTVGWDIGYLKALEDEPQYATIEPANADQRAEPSPKRVRLQEPERDAEKPLPSVMGRKAAVGVSEEKLFSTTRDTIEPLEPNKDTDQQPLLAAVAGKAVPHTTSLRQPPTANQGPWNSADASVQTAVLPKTIPVKQQPGRRPAAPSKPTSNLRAAPKSSHKNLPWDENGPARQLTLTSLSAIRNRNLPYAANWAVNVLAVVTSLTDVKVSNLKPFHERTAELADASTDQRVMLTVFHHPDSFTPRVGSVVLLLGAKNHTDGNLKKYFNPNESKKWWFEEPREYAWCDVDGMRRWWDAQQEQECR
jgi:hypothetical protein